MAILILLSATARTKIISAYFFLNTDWFAALLKAIGVVFLIAAAVSEEAFVWIKDFSITPLGTIILFAWSFALYYHTCNGVRHLIWDTVHLLEERKAVMAGWVVLVASAGLTAATWYFAAIY